MILPVRCGLWEERGGEAARKGKERRSLCARSVRGVGYIKEAGRVSGVHSKFTSH